MSPRLNIPEIAPRTPDTFCLITVLPHDKANAHAASHRFSVNQALGVLEVRDEEALQQLQPSLQAVAQTDGKRLFASVSDADLRQLGIDAQILPVVRLLSSDAHLEALQTMLPDAQYAALYSLACGMTVQEAWAEVAQLLPAETPPDVLDPDDLVSAMERTSKAQRSQVWQAAEHVAAELKTARQSTYIQLVNEATHLLRETGKTLYRHVIVDEGQDLHPARWQLLRAVVPPAPDDLFIAADPHQRIYDNRVSP